PASEQLGGLERRRLDPRVPGRLEDPPRLPLHGFTGRRLVGQDVEGPPRNLQPLAHPRASSARNGFVSRSAPRVVRPICPGCPRVSGGSVSISVRIDASSVPQSAPGRSTRPTDPWKSTSPEKIACSSGIE